MLDWIIGAAAIAGACYLVYKVAGPTAFDVNKDGKVDKSDAAAAVEKVAEKAKKNVAKAADKTAAKVTKNVSKAADKVVKKAGRPKKTA